MSLNVDHLLRTADTLEHALIALNNNESKLNPILFDLYRNAAIKSFELSLETVGKLLRRALKAYVGSPRSIDALVFNDVLRYAGKYGLLTEAEVLRWLNYRANRNTTAHDYGENFADETLKLLPDYLADVRVLAEKMKESLNA
jgi:nucleotidyltransferase substrate binding protein (TIGR01987 family)